MLGLEPEVGPRPFARNDDDRGNAAEFTGDLLPQQRLRGISSEGCFTGGATFTGSKHDVVVADSASGDVDMVDGGGPNQVLPDVRVSADDAEKSATDQRRKASVSTGSRSSVSGFNVRIVTRLCAYSS
jgi:hypothetical protein